MAGRIPLILATVATAFAATVCGCGMDELAVHDAEETAHFGQSVGELSVLRDFLEYQWVPRTVVRELGSDQLMYRFATCRTIWVDACVEFPPEIGAGCSFDFCQRTDWVVGLYVPGERFSLVAIGLWPEVAEQHGYVTSVGVVGIMSLEDDGQWHPAEDGVEGGVYSHAVWSVLANRLADEPPVPVPPWLIQTLSEP